MFGGLVGLGRGLVGGLVCMSFLGSLLYIFAGGIGEKKYDDYLKDVLTIMSLFIAIISFVSVNADVFKKEPNAYIVIIVNLSIIIAITLIFMFIYKLIKNKVSIYFIIALVILIIGLICVTKLYADVNNLSISSHKVIESTNTISNSTLGF